MQVEAHFSPEGQDGGQGRSEATDLELQGSPCRWQVYCAECIAEIVCGTLLIIIVYTEGARGEGNDITEASLNYLFLAVAISGLKYMALRLLPTVYVGSTVRVPSDLGPISAWSRIAAHRRRVRAKAWSIPAVAGVCALLCMVILVAGDAQRLALMHLCVVFGVNAFITVESFVAAGIGCRRGYREVFPEVEGFAKPVKYRELARNSKGRCDAKCAICLQDFIPQESAVRLPCGHIFHTECAGKWMSRGHGCPYRCSYQRLPPAGA